MVELLFCLLFGYEIQQPPVHKTVTIGNDSRIYLNDKAINSISLISPIKHEVLECYVDEDNVVTEVYFRTKKKE